MIYANKNDYVFNFCGNVIPLNLIDKYCTFASYCIDYIIPKNSNIELNRLQRCCCKIAEILYNYCSKNSVDLCYKKDVIALMIESEQTEIQIRNTIILYLQINILQKAE